MRRTTPFIHASIRYQWKVILVALILTSKKKKEENNIPRYATFISHIYERRRHEGEFFDSSTIGSMTNDP